ncbi:MAG TPA: hypothetical protein VK558_06165 [Patescibacteria group bacterium]|nr:hypothetical protein [Patescibacteria group bacterium]
MLRKMAAIRRGDLVFPGYHAERPLSNKAMAMVLRRMTLAVTPHGFRRLSKKCPCRPKPSPTISSIGVKSARISLSRLCYETAEEHRRLGARRD